MAEDTEKSIEERIEEAPMKQAVKIGEAAASLEPEWACNREEHKEITDENIKEHVEECLGEILYSYIGDERNYIVDGAVIKCDQMSDKNVTLMVAEDAVKLFGEGGEAESTEYTKPGIATYYDINAHVGEESIRKLRVVSGNYQLDNGIPFATVIDRTCLREEEKKLEPKAGTGVADFGTGINTILAKQRASIVSCGNCKIIRDEDIKEIVENMDKVRKYGTCYLFIKPDLEWINPYCMESVEGKCEREEPMPVCTISTHHKTMKFSTKKGEKEGLTMLSTLLCTRGGVITIESPGQIYIEPKSEKNNTVVVQGVSNELIALLKKYETGEDTKGKLLPLGEPALNAYQGNADSSGVMTIGWGHAMFNKDDGYITFNGITKDLYDGTKSITYAEAEELLNRDIEKRVNEINLQLQNRGIADKVNQQFYDALFLLYFQNDSIFTDADFSGFLSEEKFNIDDEEEIILQFCEYSSNKTEGVMKRRADELDIIFYDDYEYGINSEIKDEAKAKDVNRYELYGYNIWGELTARKERGET